MTRPRRVVSAAVLVAVAAVGLPVALAGPAAASETYVVPSSRTLAFAGHGLGHGIGMSQFGAQGMGLQGKSAAVIVGFYYPGTTLATAPSTTNLRVLLSNAPRSVPGGEALVVRPAAGLTATDATRGRLTLPATVSGAAVTEYRAVLGSGGALSLVAATGSATTVVASGLTGPVRFATSTLRVDSRVTLVGPAGVNRPYRGFLSARSWGGQLRVVDDVLLDGYARSVVSSEMPGGWTAAAYGAQAIAARSYALASRDYARARGNPWDICDTTMCQVYGGALTEGSAESAAVAATARQYLSYGGGPAFAQFSASNGGWSVAGSQPYLVARQDPYDGVVTGAANWGHSWTVTRSASALESAWPQVGVLKDVRVLGRDGNGAWGGRVQSVALDGSSGTVTVSADSFRFALGLDSTWWTITNATTTATAPPTSVSVVPRDRALAVSWKAPTGGAGPSGYRVSVSPGGATLVLPASARSVTVPRLVNGSPYTVTVSSRYSTGQSRAAASVASVPTSVVSYFRAVSPARLLDTGPRSPLAAQGGTTVPVLGVGGVPAQDVRSVVLKVSAMGATTSGTVRVWPAGHPEASQAALTFAAQGGRAAGLVTVAPGQYDRVGVSTSSAVRYLRVDVVGYYTESGLGLVFHPQQATRLVDTRSGLGATGPVVAGTPRPVLVAGRAGVPTSGAVAVLVNVTVMGPSRPTGAWAATSGAPSVAPAVVADAGDTRTVATVARLTPDGRLMLSVGAGSAQMVVDVLGWYGRNPGLGTGRFRTVAPTAVPGVAAAIPAGGVRQVTVLGLPGVPTSGVAAVALEVGASGSGDGHLSLRRDPSTLSYAAVRFDPGAPGHNLVVVPVGADGTVTVGAHSVAATAQLAVVGWYSR